MCSVGPNAMRRIGQRLGREKRMTRNDPLVSRTWTSAGSSDLGAEKDSPPRTKTREPAVAIAWPDRPFGDGPIF